MKIAFVSSRDVNNKNYWSGTTYYIYHNLKSHFEEVVLLSPIKVKNSFLKFLFSPPAKILSLINGKRNLDIYSSYILPKTQGKLIDDCLKHLDVDCVISTESTPFLYTQNRIPLIIITDSTVKLLFEEYSLGKGWSRLFLRALEKNAVKITKKASLIVSSSTITSSSLTEDYNVPPNKIATIPFGANIENSEIAVPAREINKEIQIRILFVGKDWKRKGGDFVIKVCDQLISKGLDIILTVVGCQVPEYQDRTYAKNYVYLDKNKTDEYSLLISLFKESHFLMVFSDAEMYGLVFCEAAAYGLPVVCFAVGGINDIVINDKTGIILPKDSSPEIFADNTIALVDDPDKYLEMSKNARMRYEELLNWTTFSTTLKSIIKSRIKQIES